MVTTRLSPLNHSPHFPPQLSLPLPSLPCSSSPYYVFISLPLSPPPFPTTPIIFLPPPPLYFSILAATPSPLPTPPPSPPTSPPILPPTSPPFTHSPILPCLLSFPPLLSSLFSFPSPPPLPPLYSYSLLYPPTHTSPSPRASFPYSLPASLLTIPITSHVFPPAPHSSLHFSSTSTASPSPIPPQCPFLLFSPVIPPTPSPPHPPHPCPVSSSFPLYFPILICLPP